MTRRKNKIKASHNNDIIGIVLITIGIIMFFSIFSSNSGILIYYIKKMLFTLLGIGSYVIPILIIFIGFCYIAKKSKISFSKRFFGILLSIVNSLLLIQMLNMDQYYDYKTVLSGINRIYVTESIFHGGIFSYLIDIPLYKLLGEPVCYIIFVATYCICLVLIFDISIYDLLSLFQSPNKQVKEVKSNVSNELQQEKQILHNSIPEIEEKSNFLSSLNKKIKIIDFMRNINSDTTEKANIIQNSNIVDSSLSVKDKDNDVKEEINKVLTEKIIQSSSVNIIEYHFPSSELLNQNSSLKLNKDDKKELLSNATKLEETLSSFGVEAKVVQVTKGPSVTRFELQPNSGVKVSKIVNLADDIALNLAASGVRIEAPIPGKSAVGIEVPNKELTPVYIREVVESDEFISSTKSLAFCLGKDIAGHCVVSDLTKMPHLLIAGATGSGKSVCINTLIVSILYKYSPEEVKLLMIDPKVVELNVYNGIPQLLIPVVTDPKKAAGALNWAVNEMTRRYKVFAENGVKNIQGYNDLYIKAKISEKLPLIVIIVDELADLMMVCPNDIEDYIGRLAQMARAAGMHLVIATQRPSVDVITGVIKANIPSRISFAVSSQIDSRTILDSSGAEKLLGKGDMLFYPVGESKPIRIQGAFISDDEVEKVVDFIKSQQNETEYKTEIIDHIEGSTSESSEDNDELIEEAITIVVESGQASTSLLQRRLRVGYNRAARIMEQLEKNGTISTKDGSKPRQILVDKSEYLSNNYVNKED